MPVLGRRCHESGGEGEQDDGGAEDHSAGVDVGEQPHNDPGDGEDGGEGRAGEDLVLYSEAGVVPVTLQLRLATVGEIWCCKILQLKLISSAYF